MDRPRSELQTILSSIPTVKKAYFQKPTTLEYPCIVYDVDNEYVAHASDAVYQYKTRYSITVIDRNPDSQIPSAIRGLKYSRFDRKYVVDALHHTVYTLYF